MIIDPVRGNSPVPAGAVPAAAAKPQRPSQSVDTVVLHGAADETGSASSPAAPTPDANREIKQLRPPVNVMMAQLGGQALLGAELLSGVSTADLSAALGNGLIKPGAAMRAAAEFSQQVPGAVDAKA